MNALNISDKNYAKLVAVRERLSSEQSLRAHSILPVLEIAVPNTNTTKVLAPMYSLALGKFTLFVLDSTGDNIIGLRTVHVGSDAQVEDVSVTMLDPMHVGSAPSVIAQALFSALTGAFTTGSTMFDEWSNQESHDTLNCREADITYTILSLIIASAMSLSRQQFNSMASQLDSLMEIPSSIAPRMLMSTSLLSGNLTSETDRPILFATNSVISSELIEILAASALDAANCVYGDEDEDESEDDLGDEDEDDLGDEDDDLGDEDEDEDDDLGDEDEDDDLGEYVSGNSDTADYMLTLKVIEEQQELALALCSYLIQDFE